MNKVTLLLASILICASAFAQEPEAKPEKVKKPKKEKVKKEKVKKEKKGKEEENVVKAPIPLLADTTTIDTTNAFLFRVNINDSTKITNQDAIYRRPFIFT